MEKRQILLPEKFNLIYIGSSLSRVWNLSSPPPLKEAKLSDRVE